ncbi:hypothetical protein [Burkholderia sp. 572]|uniref:hypothetical protein n=1 Tax=Burkholderia sp. 572 TaxID=3156414 RepID=UPI0033960DDF
MTVPNTDATPIAIAWLEKSDYWAFRALLKHGLPPTYEAWERRTKRILTHITRRGEKVVKVGVSPNEFVAWCNRQHRDVTRISLQIYVDMT